MKLFIDLETIPDQSPDALDRAKETVKVPANYKKAEVIKKYIDEHAEDEHRKTALKGISGEICSIAWAVDDGEIQVLNQDNNTPETDVLTRFFVSLVDISEYPRYRWIGHNLIDFDLRFLKQRCWICGIKPLVSIPADARHGDFAFDVMKEWAGWRGYVKQDDLYKALGGQPYEDDDMDGSQVWDYFKAGRFEEIAEYNKRDIEKLRYNYSRLV